MIFIVIIFKYIDILYDPRHTVSINISVVVENEEMRTKQAHGCMNTRIWYSSFLMHCIIHC